jgi:hypothetical protein
LGSDSYDLWQLDILLKFDVTQLIDQRNDRAEVIFDEAVFHVFAIKFESKIFINLVI